MKGKDFTLLMAAMVVILASVLSWKYSKYTSEPSVWQGISILSLFAFAGILAFIWSNDDDTTDADRESAKDI